MHERPSRAWQRATAFLAAVSISFLFSKVAQALDLSYGGRLTTATGEPVVGAVNITFRFYREASGGSALVSVPVPNTALVDGIFQAPIPLSAEEVGRLFEGGDQTVYVEVESQGRIYPRQRFSYVPLALRVPVDGSKITYDSEGRLTFGPGAATSLLGLGSMATRNSVALSDLPSCADGNILRFSGNSWTCAALLPSLFGANLDSSEFAALDGVTSSIQTQLNGKLSASGGTVTGPLMISQGSELRLASTNVGISSGFKAPSNMTTSAIYTLPPGFGTNGQVLSTSSTGALSWTNIPVSSVNGQTGSVSLNADNINETANRKYYSHTLARQALSSTGLLSYNSITGVMSLSDTLLTKSGGTMTGSLDFGGTQKVSNLSDPTSPGDATRKAYVDAKLGGQPLDVGTPSPGQVVKWDGSKFALATDALGEPGGGIASLNALTADSQSLAIDVPGVATGIRPTWTAITETSTHRLTIPMASLSGVTAGLLAKIDYDKFSAKQEAITITSAISTGSLATNQQNGLEIGPYGTESSNTGEMRFRELGANGINYVGFKGPGSLQSNVIWTLPSNDGPGGYVLSTDGAGTLEWISPSTGSITNIATGTGLTGGPVTSVGTIALANVGTAGTYTKVTTNAQGQVTSGSMLAESDIPNLNAAKITNGNVSVALGGTGATSFTNNGVLVGSGTSPLSATVAGTQYQVLRTGAGGAPEFGPVNLDQFAAVTGILSLANGGTGAATAAAGRSNLGAAVSGANSDITSLSGLTTALSLTQGGTGAASASAARSSLGAAAAGMNTDITSLANLTSVTTSGNLGIGSATPGAKLDVAGGGRFVDQSGLELAPFGTLAGNTSELRFDELSASGSNYVGFKAPSMVASNIIWTLPPTDGANGSVLSTDGNGAMSWLVIPTAPVATVAGRTGAVTLSNQDISGLGSLATDNAVSGGSGGMITDDTITDADISAGAAIVDTKLATIATSGKVANSATTAASANAASAIVARDASGNFAAGTITATLNGNATNVSGTVAIANGGTGATTAIGAFDALSPLTTLGDILYSGANGTDSRLPGNSSTTKQFLSSSGNGTAAGAPAWGALSAGDIPNLDVSKITTGTFDNTRINWASPGAIGTTAASSGQFTTLTATGGTNLATLTGNVGIASTSPTSRLDVNGDVTITDKIIHSGDIDSVIRFPAADTITAETGGTERIRISSDGNVGIGTTGPSALLQINGANSNASTGNPLLRLTDTNLANSYIAIDNGANASAYRIVSSFTPPGSIANARNIEIQAGNTSNQLVVHTSGNVGLGASNPVARLEVNGGVKLANDSASCTSSKAGTVRFDGTNYLVCRSNAWFVLGSNSTSASAFACTGADQTYNVPVGVTSVAIKMWGAGGGGGAIGVWVAGYPGGAGGFTSGNLAVTPGQVLTVIVGCGGRPGNATTTTGAYGGGARGCNTGTDCRYGGGGGGRSAIRNATSTELMTAGGGGGGGSSRTWTYTQDGGAGGGLKGQDGASGELLYGKGLGGAQYYGGSGGQASSNGSAGTQFTGGTPGSHAYGGGGGGGWYGGGGGSYQESNTMGGGGGGSGYIGGSGVTEATTIGGWGTTPPETRDYHYVQGIAIGGQGHSSPTWGGDGRIVIIPN